MRKNKKYNFSVIIPIYNTEKYLKDSIESIINQDIGFEENIQLILVNDGSDDDSENICQKYKKKYPNNIKIINQTNHGVSFARNIGLKNANGCIINFMDSDDVWELSTLRKALNFFKANNDLNILACRFKFFELRNEYPRLDFKFNYKGELRKICIDVSCDYIQLNVNSCFIKLNAITNEFDLNLNYAEDTKFITEIILNYGYYYLCNSIIYNYRVRRTFDSIMQKSNCNKDSFIESTEKCFCDLIIKSKKDCYLNYLYNLLLFDLHWKVRGEYLKSIINNTNIISIIEHIEPKMIIRNRFLKSEQKSFLLKIKDCGEKIHTTLF